METTYKVIAQVELASSHTESGWEWKSIGEFEDYHSARLCMRKCGNAYIRLIDANTGIEYDRWMPRHKRWHSEMEKYQLSIVDIDELVGPIERVWGAYINKTELNEAKKELIEMREDVRKNPDSPHSIWIKANSKIRTRW